VPATIYFVYEEMVPVQENERLHDIFFAYASLLKIIHLDRVSYKIYFKIFLHIYYGNKESENLNLSDFLMY
jgi:hypothetical protein